MKVTLVFVAEPEQVGRALWTAPLTTPLLAERLATAGHQVDLLDTRLLEHPPGTPQWDRTLADRLAATDGDVVGISFMSHSRADGLRVAELCRAAGRRTVAGGPHATVRPGELARTGLFDVVVRGEGERALIDVLNDLRHARGESESGRVVEGEPFVLDHYPPLRDVALYREVYRPPETLTMPEAARLAGLPEGDLRHLLGVTGEAAGPPREAIPVSELHRLAPELFPVRREFRSIYLELGRGCPFRCRFCTLQNDWFSPKRPRHRPFDAVRDEIRHYVERFGTNYVIVVDSIAPAYTHFPRFVELMKTEFPAVEFSFNSTAVHFTREVADLLEGANCLVWFGLETASPRMARRLRKPGHARGNRRTARMCNERGIRFGVNLLIGVPGETPEDHELTLRFLGEARPYSPNPNILTPLPGTALYDECAAAGSLRAPDDFHSWTAAEVRRTGQGPVLGVDYAAVLDVYDRMLGFDRTGEVVHVERNCHLKPSVAASAAHGAA
ncbi:B12-binding domain-containing radical SAM protein [Streptomyces sp. NPDC017941]|uniref:B12-binding domain-containing radical SAM protein n=1 Tax=Streptomyces sp. NPDC017941 TaxID=3365018 RepID=UPI0037A3E2AC